jgi:predicted nucleic acid-binding Zn ribbon protein
MIEVEHSMSEPHPTTHEGCGGEMAHLFDSQADVIYKSGGFYTTDRRLDKHSDE